MNKNIIFPYYSGNIFLSKCIGHVTLDYFIKVHDNPPHKAKELFEIIRNTKNDKKKRLLKQSLYSFTPSVLIPIGKKRKYENIEKWTGLMQLDFDHLPNIADAQELKNYLFNKYKHIVCIYLSPSGKGVKALIKIKIPKNKKHYKALHKAVAQEMEQYSYFDKATTNAMLPLFLSMDKSVLFRDYDNCWTWEEEDWEKTEYVELNTTKNFTSNYDVDNYAKTIRIFTEKINNININGHTQLRSACLILGSRAGANYILINEAFIVAEQLIKQSSYLSKGIQGYVRTANWAIKEGYKNPKYYK